MYCTKKAFLILNSMVDSLEYRGFIVNKGRESCILFKKFLSWIVRYFIFFYPLNPKSDQHLFSLHNNIAESFIKIMRIREMITKLRNFHYKKIKFLLISTREIVEKWVRGICTLMFRCKGFTDCSSKSQTSFSSKTHLEFI